MSCKNSGMCKSAAACFINGGCLETGEKWVDCGAIDNQTVEPEDANEDEDNGDAVSCNQGLIHSWQRGR